MLKVAIKNHRYNFIYIILSILLLIIGNVTQHWGDHYSSTPKEQIHIAISIAAWPN